MTWKKYYILSGLYATESGWQVSTLFLFLWPMRRCHWTNFYEKKKNSFHSFLMIDHKDLPFFIIILSLFFSVYLKSKGRKIIERPVQKMTLCDSSLYCHEHYYKMKVEYLFLNIDEWNIPEGVEISILHT